MKHCTRRRSSGLGGFERGLADSNEVFKQADIDRVRGVGVVTMHGAWRIRMERRDTDPATWSTRGDGSRESGSLLGGSQQQMEAEVVCRVLSVSRVSLTRGVSCRGDELI